MILSDSFRNRSRKDLQIMFLMLLERNIVQESICRVTMYAREQLLKWLSPSPIPSLDISQILIQFAIRLDYALSNIR